MAENEMMEMTTDVEVETGENDGTKTVGTAVVGLWTVGAIAGIAAAAKTFGGSAIGKIKTWKSNRKAKKAEKAESNEVE